MRYAFVYGGWLGDERGIRLMIDPIGWLGQFKDGLFAPAKPFALNPWYPVDDHQRDPNIAERWTVRNMGLFKRGVQNVNVMLLTESNIYNNTFNNLTNSGYYLLEEISNEYSEEFETALLERLKQVDCKSIAQGKHA